MKYPNWYEMNEEQKLSAVEQELELATHNGTTRCDLLNMISWLRQKFVVEEKHHDN